MDVHNVVSAYTRLIGLYAHTQNCEPDAAPKWQIRHRFTPAFSGRSWSILKTCDSNCMLGNAKADFLVGLRDRRIMAIECKVSNSSINSLKRLNREAAGKAEVWIREFGSRNVVPVAVPSGVFRLHNIRNAQDCGLTVFWAHDLNRLFAWMDGAV
jgi:hypothetical protein